VRNEIIRNSRILAELPPDLLLQVQSILRREGFTDIRHVPDRHAIFPLIKEFRPDLFLLDCTMPAVDALSLLKQLRAYVTDRDYLPILAITSERTRNAHKTALALGAKDLISKPLEATEFLLRVQNLLETRWLNHNLENEVVERTKRLTDAQDELLHCLATVVDYRDDHTGKHGRRVGRMAGLIAEQLHLPAKEVQQITAAAVLHDIGKVGIPDSILLKTGKLDAEEFELVKAHTSIGADILASFTVPVLKMAEQVARYHHERWDGRGYMRLKGDQIPLAARITALADALDVMLQGRVYRAARSLGDAMAEVRRERGAQFDPELVDALTQLLNTDLQRLQQAVLPEEATVQLSAERIAEIPAAPSLS
jgi:response regulator RpfG family c-di-GMP phosphodiesterase